MPSLALLWSDYKHFSWLLWNQFMQALHQQLSDSPATPAATSHPTALTSTSPLRGHCPGAPGSTVKECANETTAQPNRCNMKIHWASFTMEGTDRAESRNDTYTSLWHLCRMQYGSPRFLSSCHLCSPHSQSFPGLEHPQHHNSLTWHPPMHRHC